MGTKKSTKTTGPISPQQKRVIWSIAKKALQMDSEALYAVIFRLFEKEHMSDLLSSEAELLISELKRLDAGLAVDALTEPQYRKIMAMSAEFGWTAQGLRQFVKKETCVEDVKWLNVQQARVVITGLEKVRAWKARHPEEVAVDGIR